MKYKTIDKQIQIEIDKLKNWNCESIDDVFYPLEKLWNFEEKTGKHIELPDLKFGKPQKEILEILNRGFDLNIINSLITFDNKGNLLENKFEKLIMTNFFKFYDNFVFNNKKFSDLQL